MHTLNNGKRYFSLVEEHQTYHRLGGLTFDEYRSKVEREIVLTEPPEIFESFKVADTA